MSIGLLTGEDEAVIWRGPMLMGALQQMLGQVRWGPLDVLIVDLPPGTGDVQMTLCQKAEVTGAIVVSTPQDVALIDARKALNMFNKMNVRVLGMVENMSTYVCPNCGHEAHIFGHGGARADAERLGVPFLGEIPLDLENPPRLGRRRPGRRLRPRRPPGRGVPHPRPPPHRRGRRLGRRALPLLSDRNAPQSFILPLPCPVRATNCGYKSAIDSARGDAALLIRRMLMITRRDALALAAGAVLAPLGARAATEPFILPEHLLPTLVRVKPEFELNSIHILPAQHQLYFITGPGEAIRYGVGVGKAGLEFHGIATVDVKKEWPTWRPTDEMIERDPESYAQYADGMEGGPNNPLGARALYLFQNGYDTFYRIHGTNQPQTVGTSVSNGCIRMVNDHVVDLYNRVPLGARVWVY